MADTFVDIDADQHVVKKDVYVPDASVTAEAHESRLVANYEAALLHLRDGDKLHAKGSVSTYALCSRLEQCR